MTVGSLATDEDSATIAVHMCKAVTIPPCPHMARTGGWLCKQQEQMEAADRHIG